MTPQDASPQSPQELTAPALEALGTVIDPEIRLPITELGMVGQISFNQVDAGFDINVEVFLTTEFCPLRNKILDDAKTALLSLGLFHDVTLTFNVMDVEQRRELQEKLRGTHVNNEVPFASANSLTKVFAIASGKGGVGKSTLTANLAAAMAASGLRVGVLDADIHGFSIPTLLGVTTQPVRIDRMLIPPVAHGIKVVSIGMFVGPDKPVVWRGPKLHRAIEQFLCDVYWGDLDVLLLDLPPGTGDIAISVSQLLPNSEVLVVTTPQISAATVAQRAGGMAISQSQKVIGVVENMAWLPQSDGSRLELFGSGGGELVAKNLSQLTGSEVRVLSQVPMTPDFSKAAEDNVPSVLAYPDSESSKEIRKIAEFLLARKRNLSGMKLNISPK